MSTNSALFAGLPELPPLDGVDPSRNPLDAFKLAAAAQLSSIADIPLFKVFEAIQIGAKGCDCNVAIPRFKLGGDAKAHAKRIAEAFVPNDYIAKAEFPGTPFVYFHFHTPTLSKLVLHSINQLTHLDQPSTSATTLESGKPSVSAACRHGYGTNSSGVGKTVVLDFSSPNIAKPFHAGHLRSTIIGMFIANVYTANGWDTVKINYLGDWGKQFGILAVGFDKYGSEELIKTDAIKHLYDVYVKINRDATDEMEHAIKSQRKQLIEEASAKGETATIVNDRKETVELTMDMDFTRVETEYGNSHSPTHNAARAVFKRMEDGEEEAVAIWRRFRDLSINKYKELYARLNIEFDIYGGESTVSAEAQNKAIEVLVEKDIAKEDKGALLIDLTKYKLGKTPVRKRDGTTLYITRDIGGAVERYEKYKFDKMIYVVASQQELNFQQLFKVMDLMEYPWAKNMIHINFGMVMGMSTRKGTVVFLEDILQEAQEVMHNQMKGNEEKYAAIEDPEHTSDVIGITGVKVQDMAGKRGNNYEFKWDRMLSFEGDTGPYLQYAHVRLASVERKAAPEIVLPPHSERPTSIDSSLLVEPKARDVLYLLATYPDVIKKACETLEPSNIVTFLFRLSHAISSAWEVLLVRGQSKDVALARLWLFVSARDVIASAMKILSLTPLERM